MQRQFCRAFGPTARRDASWLSGSVDDLLLLISRRRAGRALPTYDGSSFAGANAERLDLRPGATEISRHGQRPFAAPSLAAHRPKAAPSRPTIPSTRYCGGGAGVVFCLAASPLPPVTGLLGGGVPCTHTDMDSQHTTGKAIAHGLGCLSRGTRSMTPTLVRYSCPGPGERRAASTLSAEGQPPVLESVVRCPSPFQCPA